MKTYYYIFMSLFLSFCTGCSTSFLFSQKVPEDVYLGDNKCIAYGLGSCNYAVFKFPDDEKTRNIFNQWWSHTKRMGTNSIFPWALPEYRIYFSKQLTVYFTDVDEIIVFEYSGNKRDGDTIFYKKANKYDIALMNHIRNIVDTQKRLPESEAKRLGEKCANYFDYEHGHRLIYPVE